MRLPSKLPSRLTRALTTLPVAAAMAGLAIPASLAQQPGAGAPPPPTPADFMRAELFIAIRKGDLATAKTLLDKGADPNSICVLGFTALMFAAGSGQEEMCLAILAKGGKLDEPSNYGTALTFATMSPNPNLTKVLLEKGAAADAKRGDNITPLMIVSGNGQTEIARTLLAKVNNLNAKDADGQTALTFAARFGRVETGRMLIEKGAEVNAADKEGFTPLMHAAANAHAEFAQMLIEKGANVNVRDKKGRTPVIIATRYGREPKIVKMLVAKGADPNAKDNNGRTAMDTAVTSGDAEWVKTLRACGAKPGSVTPARADQRMQDAIHKGLSLVEKSTQTFTKAAGCTSCHHQGLGMMTTAFAKERGFKVNEGISKHELTRVHEENKQFAPLLDMAMKTPGGEGIKLVPFVDIGEAAAGFSYMMSGLATNNYPKDQAIETNALFLARLQDEDGRWSFAFHREPLQSSHFATTALSIRILKQYGAKENAQEISGRIEKAKQWIIKTPATSNEDKTFRLLGLQWAGADKQEIEKAAKELKSAQRTDGGWAQLADMRSDAYATGQALWALNQAGGLAVKDASFQKGIQFLLKTQDEEGAWYVHKRAIPANTYLDAGFPFGASQYASYSGTCWGTMALILAAGPAQTAKR
jgi:ankyrin repeat protein